MSRLEDLPPELLFEILVYITASQNRCPSPLPPLNCLAATNKQLHAIVEEYARLQLKKITTLNPIRPHKKYGYRMRFLGETCQFCKRKSQRRATFYPTFTCCRLCDKQYFPKMVRVPHSHEKSPGRTVRDTNSLVLQTMTQAIKEHDLSKLDLFTPNPLHTHLPPLTTGAYSVGGDVATMILNADVFARKAYIAGLLGAQAGDEKYMRCRVHAHDRIIAHMGLYFHTGNGEWRKAPGLSEKAFEKATKSMRTEERRREYVKNGLEREWAAMGLGGEGDQSGMEVDGQDGLGKGKHVQQGKGKDKVIEYEEDGLTVLDLTTE